MYLKPKPKAKPNHSNDLKFKTKQIIGLKRQTIGTSLSFTLFLVNNPKEYKPRSGPYVYPAALNKASMIVPLSK